MTAHDINQPINQPMIYFVERLLQSSKNLTRYSAIQMHMQKLCQNLWRNSINLHPQASSDDGDWASAHSQAGTDSSAQSDAAGRTPARLHSAALATLLAAGGPAPGVLGLLCSALLCNRSVNHGNFSDLKPLLPIILALRCCCCLQAALVARELPTVALPLLAPVALVSVAQVPALH